MTKVTAGGSVYVHIILGKKRQLLVYLYHYIAPVIANTVTEFTIPEDKGRAMEVFALEVTDKDTLTSGLQVSIDSITPDHGALFYVDVSKVKTSKTLDIDAEVGTSYSLIIQYVYIYARLLQSKIFKAVFDIKIV